MLLVIGKPGSGCTTFLKAMANMREEYKLFEGQIMIGGRDAIETKQTSPGHFVFAGMISHFCINRLVIGLTMMARRG
jgi:ABC-type multidrug transport system ATPase subunit